ncbi:putative methyltransferase-domain-containing protein [Boletus edulis BED1]|uniref:Methyltransferase-domain-containing protein n=1 Tax=Boletus edulis BED1 TaxID=1328754 RepID=A0AAD4GEE1_BOLED|nr:putative methyltransferase-domain-containing protein [Boletus edulis BED1]
MASGNAEDWDVVVAKDCWLGFIATSMITMIQPLASRLPPIATCSTTQLSESIQYLQTLYRPQVRGSRRRRREDDASPDDDVRSDAFERAYAIRWLTALIAQLDVRASYSIPSESDQPTHDTDSLIQQAASLLATCAGVAAAGKVQRRFTFESTLVGEVHVDLTDMPLDNHDYGSVGAQTWGGACVLAEMIAEHPDRFGLGAWSSSISSASSGTALRPLRILELGAGTGLVGLTVAKLVHALLQPWKSPTPNLPLASIVLTDVYPAVLDNLQSNIDANFPTVPDDTLNHAIRIHNHPLDWSSFSTTDTLPDTLSTPFDVVFGADIVYEAQHAVWIRDCLRSLLAHPDSSSKDPVFHLVIPLRPTHTFESSMVEEVFGAKGHALEGSQRELTILTKESIVCEAYGEGSERSCMNDDDVEYVYYRIGWT